MSELDAIREITNTEPAPEAKETEPPVCPACGHPLVDMECVNEECSEGVS